MAQVTEVIAAIRAVTVTKEFLVTRKLESVRRGVPQAMKESTVTKVNNTFFVVKIMYITISQMVLFIFNI